MAGGADAIRIAVIRREPGVVEDRTEPRTGVVAGLACCREPSRNVVRVVGPLIIRLMAPITSCRQGRVVVVDVALRARNSHVEAGQRKRRQIVVERCLQPRGGVVADLAGVGESNRSVRGIVGAVVIRHVARRARRIGQVVIPVHVTLRARSSQVHARQWEPCVVVVECRG